MVRIPQARIDQIISEDVPYIDLTSVVLGIGGVPGRMAYYTREECVLAGVQVAKEVMGRVGCKVVSSRCDGDLLAEGETFMEVTGDAADLHAAWKVCLNLFDHLSAVATKTRQMVEAVHAESPRCEVSPRARASLAPRTY